jgi:hypothetical protein
MQYMLKIYVMLVSNYTIMDFGLKGQYIPQHELIARDLYTIGIATADLGFMQPTILGMHESQIS